MLNECESILELLPTVNCKGVDLDSFIYFIIECF